MTPIDKLHCFWRYIWIYFEIYIWIKCINSMKFQSRVSYSAFNRSVWVVRKNKKTVTVCRKKIRGKQWRVWFLKPRHWSIVLFAFASHTASIFQRNRVKIFFFKQLRWCLHYITYWRLYVELLTYVAAHMLHIFAMLLLITHNVFFFIYRSNANNWNFGVWFSSQPKDSIGGVVLISYTLVTEGKK